MWQYQWTECSANVSIKWNNTRYYVLRYNEYGVRKCMFIPVIVGATGK